MVGLVDEVGGDSLVVALLGSDVVTEGIFLTLR